MDLNICKNCGHAFAGNYCNVCGEKLYKEHDKALSHFFEEAFHFITHFDSKFFKTIWLVFTKPGLVSWEFCNGARKKYFKPVSLFLVGVVLYLIFPAFRGLNVTLDSHLSQNKALHITFPVKWVKAKLADEQVTYQEFNKHFEEKSPKASKLLLFIIIPLTGLLLRVMFRKPRRFYFDHFTLAAEINTFYLYFVFLIIPLLIQIIYWLFKLFGGKHFYESEFVLLGIHLSLLSLYATIAFRRFYGLKTGRAFLKSLLFLLGHTFIVYILYRLIIFSVVMLLV